MISTIAFYTGMVVLYMLGILFCIGALIAFYALIEFWTVYHKMQIGDEIGESQDLKKEIKSAENSEEQIIKKTKDTTKARGVFGKLHDISVMTLWVVLSAIWFVLICVFGFFGICYEFISACFKRKPHYD